MNGDVGWLVDWEKKKKKQVYTKNLLGIGCGGCAAQCNFFFFFFTAAAALNKKVLATDSWG
jgi:hypothetical protein